MIELFKMSNQLIIGFDEESLAPLTAVATFSFGRKDIKELAIPPRHILAFKSRARYFGVNTKIVSP